MNKVIRLKKSSVANRRPSAYDETLAPSGLTHGELAVNYNAETVDLFTLDSNNDIVSVVDDSRFAKYFKTVYKAENVFSLKKSCRFNVITLTAAAVEGQSLTIEEGDIIGNEVNAIFVNNTSSDIEFALSTTLNGKEVKSFDGFVIKVPANTNTVNMVEVNLVFDGTTYYVRIA